MNDDLHELFKTEADKLRVGPTPTTRDMATARRRRTILLGMAGAAVTLVALAGGYAVATAGSGDPQPSAAADPRPSPTLPPATGSPSEPTPTDTPDPNISQMPARLPECGTDPLTISSIDWVRHIGPTPHEAAEDLLGKQLPAVEIDEVNVYRSDVTVLDDTGRIVAVISTYRTSGGRWDARTIYDCGNIVLAD